MYFDFLRDTREGFVDMRIGDKLILVESIIIGVISFIVMLINDYEFVVSLVVGLGCIVVVPTLVGLVPVIAWIVGIVFSLIWAVISYFIGDAILGDSPVAGGIMSV